MLRINVARFVGDASLALSPAADPLLASQLRLFVVAAFQSLGNIFVVPIIDDFSLQLEAMTSYRYLYMGTTPETSTS